MTEQSRERGSLRPGAAVQAGSTVNGVGGVAKDALVGPPFPDAPPPPRHVLGSYPSRRPFLVEFVRLIWVVLFAVTGWEVGSSVGPDTPFRLLVSTLLGASLGYVFGGIFGRRTASAVTDMEREFQRVSAADTLAGAIGLVLGLVVSTLVSLPLLFLHLPIVAAAPTVAFIYLTCAYVGYRIGRAKSEELFGLFGVKPRAAGARLGEVTILDSSALLDGRLQPLVTMRFLTGTLIVTRGVVEELQRVADSSDAARRARGRRALDTLVQMRRDPSVDVVLVEEPPGQPGEEVDAQLVRIARARGAALVTNDAALVKVAQALEVPVRSIHALAEALRPPVVPGDVVTVRLSRPGKEAGQAVGYLEDGSMVVVEGAAERLGQAVPVSITNALQTASGQMIFAELSSHRSP